MINQEATRKHHDIGRCWCGELHAREHQLGREVKRLRIENAAQAERLQQLERVVGRYEEALREIAETPIPAWKCETAARAALAAANKSE